MKDKISVIRFLYNLWYKNLYELENWKIQTPTAKSKLNCFFLGTDDEESDEIILGQDPPRPRRYFHGTNNI